MNFLYRVQKYLTSALIVVICCLPILCEAANSKAAETRVSVESVNARLEVLENKLKASSDLVGPKLEVLDAKLSLLEKINERTLNSVYWTLATLAAIFLGLISVNLYFNVSANKREIEKIKEDAEKLTNVQITDAISSLAEKQDTQMKVEAARLKEEMENILSSTVKTAEAGLIEKLDVAIQRERERSSVDVVRVKEEMENILSSAMKTVEANLTEKFGIAIQRESERASSAVMSSMRNELLTQRAELTAMQTKTAQEVTQANKSVGELTSRIRELEIDVKEVEIFYYSEKKKMGAVIGHIELLEYDLANRRWNLKFRLPELLEELEKADLEKVEAEKLRKLLPQITEKEHQDIVTKIKAAITVR